MIAVSAHTGAGLDELKSEIVRLTAEIPSRDTDAIFRLPIDRVFVMKGFGTVITGTLIAGKVKKEEEVEIFPGRQRARVRGVQVHGAASDQAIAGQRTALNLAGVQVEDLARGMTLTAPGLLESTQRIEVQLSLLADAKPLKNRARVHLHAFASETVAEVKLHEGTEIKPGTTALAQLRSEDPLLLLPGDRAILRQYSPVVTIGGAVVLDAFPLVRQKRDARIAFLKAQASGSREEALLARISRRGKDGLDTGCGSPRNRIQAFSPAAHAGRAGAEEPDGAGGRDPHCRRGFQKVARKRTRRAGGFPQSQPAGGGHQQGRAPHKAGTESDGDGSCADAAWPR